MEEKKMQAVESGSLYMTLDAFYRGDREKKDSPDISATTYGFILQAGNLYPTTECSVSTSETKV